MSTPFQKYLLESIKDYDTPPGVYYDPIRDQSVKGDDPFDFDEVLPKPNLGPPPGTDWEIGIIRNDPNFPILVLIELMRLRGDYNKDILRYAQRVLLGLPENVEDWQQYFDTLITSLLGDAGWLGRRIFLNVEGGIEGQIETILGILNEIMDNPLGGSDYLQWHIDQLLQQLIDFLSNYEYDGEYGG